MSENVLETSNCQSEQVAAYIDGELDVTARANFEQHLNECAGCAQALRRQQRFLCDLNVALHAQCALELPKNFAHIVAAHARSDMSGVRSQIEGGRALRLCALLIGLAFALLGSTAFIETARAPFTLLARSAASVCAFFWQALYGIGSSLAVILRVLGGHLIFESPSILSLPLCLLLALASALLLSLIASYHRACTME